MIVWIMVGIAICGLWLAARINSKDSQAERIIEQEITVPRQRTADRHAYAVACLERNDPDGG